MQESIYVNDSKYSKLWTHTVYDAVDGGYVWFNLEWMVDTTWIKKRYIEFNIYQMVDKDGSMCSR